MAAEQAEAAKQVGVAEDAGGATVVRFEEFKARRMAARIDSPRPEAPLSPDEPPQRSLRLLAPVRALSPLQIAHRFVMLAHLRCVASEPR